MNDMDTWHLDTCYEHLVHALCGENASINGIAIEDVQARGDHIVLLLADDTELVIAYQWANRIVEATQKES